MSIDTMHDLAITDLADGAIELCQFGGGIEEPDTIRLHPCQVRLLAEHAGLLPQADPALLDRLGARHARRLHALYARLDEIRRFYLDEIIDRCAEGIEFGLHLRALEDLVDEMIEDIGTAPAVPEQGNDAVTAPAQCHEVPASNCVTRKPGPKPSGKALSAAERQARHRAKQGELLPAGQDEASGGDGARGAAA